MFASLLGATLSQTKIPDGSLGRIAVWSVVAVAGVVVGLVVVARVKKRLQGDDEPDQMAAGFSLSDLRQLVEEGEMSDEEFDKAKVRVIAAARRAAERDAERPRAGGPPAGPSPADEP